MTQIEKELEDYGRRLDWYISYSKVPKQWFDIPDHAVIVAEDISDFQHLIVNPTKEKVVRNLEEEGRLDRFDVAAKFVGSVGLGNVGSVRWVEIIEPLPEEQIAKEAGLIAMKFYCDDFEKARYFLGARNIKYELLDHDDHAEVDVIFDNELNSFSLVNQPIELLTDARVKRGEAQEIPRAA